MEIDGISQAAVRSAAARPGRGNSGGPRPAAADALKEPVAEAARQRLENLQMCHPPHLKVRVLPRSR